MRLVVFACLISTGLATAACGDDEGTTDAMSSNDAFVSDGPVAIVDAATSDTGASDAMAPDAMGPDAMAPDATPTAPVTVTVWVAGTVAPAIAVMYHGADGGYLGTVTTDSSGVATITSFPSGGAVTVTASVYANVATTTGELTTIMGVLPGDSLTVGTSTGRPSTSNNDGSVSITYPDGASLGATRYWSWGGCGFTSGTAGLNIDEDCTTGGNVDVLTYAQDNVNNVVGWAMATSVAVSGTAPALTGSVSHSAWNTTSLARHDLVLTAPAQAIKAGVSGRFLRGNSHFAIGSTNSDVAAGQNITAQLSYPDGFPDRIRMSWSMNSVSFDETVNGVNVTASVGSVAAAGSTAVAATTSLPDIAAGLTTSGNPLTLTFTPPTWRCFGGDTDADGLLISVSAEQAPARGEKDGPAHSWRLLSPRALASGWTLPTLDPTLSATLWPQSSFVYLSTKMTYVSSSETAWTGMRTDPNVFSRSSAETVPSVGYTFCSSSMKHTQ